MPYVFLNPDGTQDLGLVVIIAHRTGVTYAHQCAGLSTELRSIEGFLIPVSGPDAARQVVDWFWTRFQGNCYPPIVEWTEELISDLSKIVAQIPCWMTVPDGEDQRLSLKLDRERIQECVEGWIPVISPYGRGILVHANSD